MIVDFAHNEAGTEAILDVAAAIAGGAAGRAAPVTAIIGTAGDRPDDTLRGHRADRGHQGPAGRDQGDARATSAAATARTSSARSGRASPRAAWIPRRCPSTRPRPRPSRRSCPGSSGAASTNGRADAPRVVVLFCHAEREDVFALLERLGARQVDVGRRCATSRRASRTSAAADRPHRRSDRVAQSPLQPVEQQVQPERELERHAVGAVATIVAIASRFG